jgi:pimeloyl-ACP methyl ester carboxylesterase
VREAPLRFYTGRDGLKLAYREVGVGRPLVLLHGFMGSSRQWLDHAHINELVKRGFRVILPDMRGHGDSSHPHDKSLYPRDVLANDGLNLIDHLGLRDYDLGGYSLGARITIRMLARGAQPARAIVAGQGLDSLIGTAAHGTNHRALVALVRGDELEVGTSEENIARRVIQLGADPRALLLVLESLVATTFRELHGIQVPALIIVGDQDPQLASANELAEVLPHSRFATTSGDHWTALTQRKLTASFTHFLTSESGTQVTNKRAGN